MNYRTLACLGMGLFIGVTMVGESHETWRYLTGAQPSPVVSLALDAFCLSLGVYVALNYTLVRRTP